MAPARREQAAEVARGLEPTTCLLKVVFGPQAQSHNLSQGLQVFTNHVKHCFAGSNAECYKPFALAIDQDFSEDCASHSVMAAAMVMAQSLRDMQDAKTSIDNVLDSIFRSHSIASEAQKSVRPFARQLLFAVIGTFSMIYQPATLSKTNSVSSFDLVRHNTDLSSPKLNTDVCTRPISALLREFKMIRDSHVITLGRSNPLTTSNISLSALKGPCGVNISFVESLDAHLVFNASSRILYLFSFPSYCAAICLGDGDSFLANIMARNHNTNTTTDSGTSKKCKMLCEEVLKSFRLLFAQDTKSRRLFSRLRRHLKEQDRYDPFFDDLCTAKLQTLDKRYPGLRSQLDPQGSVLDASDFGFLGGRLLELQQFGERYRPRKLVEMYKDKRDSEKYFTFWAVIWIGGASIVLTTIQVLLGAVQLAVSYKQLSQYACG